MDIRARPARPMKPPRQSTTLANSNTPDIYTRPAPVYNTCFAAIVTSCCEPRGARTTKFKQALFIISYHMLVSVPLDDQLCKPRETWVARVCSAFNVPREENRPVTALDIARVNMRTIPRVGGDFAVHFYMIELQMERVCFFIFFTK